MKPCRETAGVVVGCQARGMAPPEHLWLRLAANGWMPTRVPSVTIQVTQAQRSPQVVETVRSLSSYLGEHLPEVPAYLIDAAGSGGQAPLGLPLPTALAAPLRVGGVAARRGLTVPAFWFEATYVITVAAAHPHPAVRLAAALAAQAEPLVALQKLYSLDVLMYEAHRLAASDLAIVCGSACWNEPASGQWWAAGTSDVGLDQVVAAAAGLRAADLPAFRALRQHECVSTRVGIDGELPRLLRYAGSSLRGRGGAVRSALSTRRGALVHDLGVIRSNLHKIPGFVRRRLAARRSRAA